MIYNEDCIAGAKKHLANESVDLVVCDPPFGINETSFDKHYYRDESVVLKGYQEAPEDYDSFSDQWIEQAHRILKKNGSMYIISGWSNLHSILNALNKYKFHTINHIIWKFQFGVNTTTKFVTSHYHILYVKKSEGAKVTFNSTCRYGFDELDENGGKLRYQDMEDVWDIKKENKPGEIKNKNKLPDELVRKIIQYSSNRGDVVCDFFMGNFTTAYVAKRLDRVPVGFEVNPNSFDYHMPLVEQTVIDEEWIGVVKDGKPKNQGKPLTVEEKDSIIRDFNELIANKCTKKDAIATLSIKYGRGQWSLERILKGIEKPNKVEDYLKDHPLSAEAAE